MLIADGLFAFLTEPVIVGIFRRITDHFASGELAFNDYGRIGWVSRLAVKLYPQKMFKDVGSQSGYAGFKDAHHPETWNPRMRLVEEASLVDEPEVDLFPGWIRVATKLWARPKTGRAQGANPPLRVLAGYRVRGVSKRPLSSSKLAVSASPAKEPSSAMRRAAERNAPHATRDSAEPTLIRRTPSSARSFTVRPVSDDINTLTG